MEHVAVVPETQITTKEKITEVATVTELYAREMAVTNEEQFAASGDFLREIKRREKLVTDFYEPHRLNAKKAYDDILADKKSKLAPLENAENIVKSKQTAYLRAVEEERRKREEEERRKLLEEAERNAKIAAEKEAEGDNTAAEAAMTEAINCETAAEVVTVAAEKPKAEGISAVKTWKITAIDTDKVPVKLMGAMLRPVDTKAVMALIKASKGTIQIDGVRYEEDYQIRARG